MAKALVDQEVIVRPWQTWLRVVLIGAVIGLAFWVITALLARYVVEPLACRQMAEAAVCANATGVAGNIATILAGLGSIFALIRLGVARPIIVTVASAALLWNLAAMMVGLFWLEAVAWSIALYAAAYGLFAWITRYSILWVTIVVSLAIILLIRIALVL